MKRFHTLDGLRGFAALAVLGFHVCVVGGGGTPSWLVPRGYLAVDFFFMLSGFVLGLAYDGRLGVEIGPLAFMRARLARLQLTHLMGVALAAGAYFVLLSIGVRWRGSALDITVEALRTAVYLPHVGRFGSGPAYRINGVVWSLALELAANAAWALGARRATTPVLLTLAGACAALLVVMGALTGTLDHGAQAHDFWLGVLRVGFAFPVGLVLARLHKAGRLAPLGGASGTTVVALLLGFLVLPKGAAAGLLDAVIVVAFFPVLLAVGAGAVQGARTTAIFDRLGRLSYPLYVSHFAAVILVAPFALAAGAPMLRLVSVPLALGLALAVEAVEPAIRRALSPQPKVIVA